jgi:hypothetical protein
LYGSRLTHFHDCGLHETQSDDITTHANHCDPVADVKSLAAQDDEIASHRSNRFLQSERQTGGNQSDPGCQPHRVIEPDGNKAKDEEQTRTGRNALSNPERQALIPAM